MCTDELQQELEKLQEEFNEIRMSDSKKTKIHQIENLRKSIVNVHIVQNQTVKKNLREFYRNQTFKPKDLREKQTRAKRRLLNSDEKSIELKKLQRRKSNFPQRTFILKD